MVNGRLLKELYLDLVIMMVDLLIYLCLGSEFGLVIVLFGCVWVMGDNCIYLVDFCVYCLLLCIDDLLLGIVLVVNVIGKVRLIVWLLLCWGVVCLVNF